jgi:RHS repeat-associated protein
LRFLADGTGTTTNTYDAVNQLKTVTNPDGKQVIYNYDAAGQRSQMTDPDGGVFTYHYDPVGNVDHLVNPQNERTTWTYDAANRETLKCLANGSKASMSFDAAGQLRLLENTKSTGAVISSFSYTYDNVGNRTRVDENGAGQVNWTYDDTYQLTNEVRTGNNTYNVTHQYDPVGNRTTMIKDGSTTTFTYDAANQLENSLDSTGITTYTYDSAGNLRISETPSGGITTNTWDDENRRTGVELPSGIANTSTYNGDGLRVQLIDTTGTRKFIWDRENYLAETVGAGASQVIYSQRPEQYGRLVSQYRKQGALWLPSYYHYDALGSTNQVTNASEVVQNEYVYFAFGEIRFETPNPGVVNNFKWIGELGYFFNVNVNDYYVRARTYDPHLARFGSPDPSDVRLRLDELSYVYSHNSPIAFVDPSGLDSFCVVSCPVANCRFVETLPDGRDGCCCTVTKGTRCVKISSILYSILCNLEVLFGTPWDRDFNVITWGKCKDIRRIEVVFIGGVAAP